MKPKYALDGAVDLLAEQVWVEHHGQRLSHSNLTPLKSC
jgi:hypothetical protein